MAKDTPNPAPIIEAEVARQLLTNLDNIGKSQTELRTEVTAIKVGFEKDTKDIKLSVDNIVKEFEKQKAGFEMFVKGIAANRKNNPLFIPGLGEDGQRFSILRAMIAVRSGDWSGAGYEKEVMEATRQKASAVSDIGSRGEFLIPDQKIPDMIAAVYIMSAFIALQPGTGTTRVRLIDGLVAKEAKIPKFSGGVLSYWVGEEDEMAESLASVGDISLKLRKLATLVRITADMRQFVDGFENMLRNDMIVSMATKLDYSIMYGTGTDNMPLGICRNPDVTLFSAETGEVVRAKAITHTGGSSSPAVSNIPASPAGGELDFDGLDEMVGALEDRNLSPNDSAAFIFLPKYKRRLKRNKVANYDGQSELMAYLMGQPRIPDSKLAEVIGPFGTTTQIKSTQKPGQSCGWANPSSEQKFSDVFYGNWNDLVVGRAGALDIEDDAGKGKGFASDHIYLKVRNWTGTAFRRPESIVVCPDARVINAA